LAIYFPGSHSPADSTPNRPHIKRGVNQSARKYLYEGAISLISYSLLSYLFYVFGPKTAVATNM
jgi:hypothetical protein